MYTVNLVPRAAILLACAKERETLGKQIFLNLILDFRFLVLRMTLGMTSL